MEFKHYEITNADGSVIAFTGALAGKALGRFHPKSPPDSWCDHFLYKTNDGQYVCNTVTSIVKDLAEGVTVISKAKAVRSLSEVRAFFGDSWLSHVLYQSMS